LAEIRFFGYLSDLVGTRVKELTLERPMILRELVPSTFPDTNIIVLINAKAGSLDSEVTDKDSVVFMPVLSGG
jgi:molybdopterin converting factor small subunit